MANGFECNIFLELFGKAVMANPTENTHLCNRFILYFKNVSFLMYYLLVFTAIDLIEPMTAVKLIEIIQSILTRVCTTEYAIKYGKVLNNSS